MSPRHSIIMGDEIDYSLHLVFDRKGGARMARGEPGLKPGERLMKLSITLPTALFETPSIRATVKIPDGQSNVGEIEAAVALASETLRTVFGGEITVNVGDAE